MNIADRTDNRDDPTPTDDEAWFELQRRSRDRWLVQNRWDDEPDEPDDDDS